MKTPRYKWAQKFSIGIQVVILYLFIFFIISKFTYDSLRAFK